MPPAGRYPVSWIFPAPSPQTVGSQLAVQGSSVSFGLMPDAGRVEIFPEVDGLIKLDFDVFYSGNQLAVQIQGSAKTLESN